MKIFISILIVSLFSLHASAAGPGASGTAGFISSLGLTVGLGTAANKDKTIKDIDVAYSELMLDGGYYFSGFGPVAQATYRYVGQRTDPDKVSGNNLGGMGYKAGLGLGLSMQSFMFSVYYDLMSQFDLSKKSSGGSKVSYGDATGFSASFKYNWRPTWQWVVTYSSLKYSERKSGSTVVDLTDNPVTYSLYGLGLAYRF